MFPRMFLVALFGIGTKIVLLFALCDLDITMLFTYHGDICDFCYSKCDICTA